jgi:hypothetical protein
MVAWPARKLRNRCRRSSRSRLLVLVLALFCAAANYRYTGSGGRIWVVTVVWPVASKRPQADTLGQTTCNDELDARMGAGFCASHVGICSNSHRLAGLGVDMLTYSGSSCCRTCSTVISAVSTNQSSQADLNGHLKAAPHSDMHTKYVSDIANEVARQYEAVLDDGTIVHFTKKEEPPQQRPVRVSNVPLPLGGHFAVAWILRCPSDVTKDSAQELVQHLQDTQALVAVVDTPSLAVMLRQMGFDARLPNHRAALTKLQVRSLPLLMFGEEAGYDDAWYEEMGLNNQWVAYLQLRSPAQTRSDTLGALDYAMALRRAREVRCCAPLISVFDF